MLKVRLWWKYKKLCIICLHKHKFPSPIYCHYYSNALQCKVSHKYNYNNHISSGNINLEHIVPGSGNTMSIVLQIQLWGSELE